MKVGKATSVVKRIVAFTFSVAKHVFVASLRGLGCILAAAWRGTFVVKDLVHVRSKVRGQYLRCPRGHSSPIHGVFECERCHFRYEGTVLRCENPECGASTVHTPCIVCGLSIRNPYRAGHP